MAKYPDKISKARARMLINHVFFATILLRAPMEMSKDIPTAATDMVRILCNPDFFEKLSLDETIGVLAHEVLHIAYMHGLRRGTRIPIIWNFAADYAINPILKRSGLVLPKPHLDEAKYHGKSAEEIYDLVLDEVKKEAKKRGGKGDGDTLEEIFKGMHPDAIGGDIIQMPDDPNQRAKIERQIQQSVAQAANMARMAGKLTADLEILVNSLLDPAVPWQALLRDYMTRVVKSDETWSRRNRRFHNVYLPARHSERMGEVIYIGDTSGSITAEEHQRSATEISAICDQVQPEKIRVFWADTDVKGSQEFEPGDTIKVEPKGGGGTDMRVPLAHVEQFDPTVVILMTDGYTPWPETEPPYPLIVLCTTDVAVPIGQVVRV